jgi:uncharacterized protein (DUF1800 family)
VSMDSFLLLSKLAFGPNFVDRAGIARTNGQAWLEAQLKPEADDACDELIASAQWRIKYHRSSKPDSTNNYRGSVETPDIDERRPVGIINQSLEQHWQAVRMNLPAPELNFYRDAVAVATLLRSVHSKWQLREVLVDFWHNHFNVNAVGGPLIAASLPTYDREAIRAHALGNFREMLEAVAKSPAMQLYLNNFLSRAGAPNENYARELLELHTLGQDSYLNVLYSHWRDVPGAALGRPIGYIDQDVYEVARAFTGWSIEVDEPPGTGLRPETGKFAYVELWHDNYQKRVLGVEFDPYSPPMSDGQRVLDLVAEHPATARHISAKLCKRIVTDDPSEELVRAVAEVWTENRRNSNQIAKVIAAIARSAEFNTSKAKKLKRPLELVASFARATAIPLTVTPEFLSELDKSGQRLFGWGPPTGHPDEAGYWLSSHAMQQRWKLLFGLASNVWATGVPGAEAIIAGQPTVEAAVSAAHSTVIGELPDPGTRAALLGASGLKATDPLSACTNIKMFSAQLLAYSAMLQPFQLR